MGKESITRLGKAVPYAVIFVGRGGELGVLGKKLDEAFASRGNLAMLVGEAGVGKTFIAHEFASQASQRGALVLSGCCLESDWRPPYGPWVEALGNYFRMNPSPKDETLRQTLGPVAPPLSQLLPEIGALLPDLPAALPLSPDEERVRLYDALTQFLLALSKESPVLLVLDDLHWADRDSLRLLGHLARLVSRSRLLVVGTYRDTDLELNPEHPLAELLAGLHRETNYQHVVVRGFAYEEVAEYLAHQAGQPLPRALVDLIYAQTDGNPFYVREVFRHLQEERKILQRAGRWSTDFSLGELGIPEGIRRVVDRRIACLPEDTGRLLRLAAGFSAGFTFLALHALMDRPEEVLLGCLDEALAAGLLRVVTGSAPPRYDFAHAIVRHTLYEELNPDRQARLHRQIAEALKRAYAPQQMRHAAEIAAQYHGSASLPGAAKGIPYALAAAEQARAGYAHERQVIFLRMARDLSAESEPAARADILGQLAIAEAEALLLREARQTVEEALGAQTAAGAGPQAQAEFLAEASRALKEGGAGPSIWRPLVERGLALLGEQRDLLWARLMLLRDPYEPVSLGAINAMRWLGQDPQAVAIARERGDEDDYARTLDPLEWRSPQQTSAVHALVRTWQRPAAILRALDVVGRDLLKRQGDHRAAAVVYRELLETSERYGSIPGQAEALLQLAIIEAAEGEFSLARQTARRAQETILRLGPAHQLHFGVAALNSLLAYFLEGNWPETTAAATRSAASSEAGWNPRNLVAGAYAALGYARMGEEAEAKRLLAVLTPVLEQMEPTMYVHHAAIAFGGSAVWEIGAAEFASAYRHLALGLLGAGFGDTTLSHELTVARMSALLTETAEAEDYFTQARRRSEAMSLKPIRAIVDYDEALAFLHTGSNEHDARLRALLEAALAAFQALGMEGWAKRALALEERAASQAPVSRDRRAYPDGLTAREIDVLRLLAGGRTNKEIAEALVLSTGTVEQHIARIYGKIGARGRADATAYAFRHDLTRSEAE